MNDLLHDFGSHVPGTTLRDMEAIWHFANYWKHCDEWDRDWVKEAASKPNSSGRDHRHSSSARVQRGDQPPDARRHREGRPDRVVDVLTPLLARASEWRVQALSGCGCTVRQADA